MPDVVIAPRLPTHLDAAVAALWQVHLDDAYPMVWPDDPTGWLTPSGSLGAWVALADDAVVGHAVLVPGAAVEFAPQLADAADVQVTGLAGVGRLFVAPAARGTGAARALLQHLDETAAERGLRLALDVVDDGGVAMRVYERLGWVRVAVGPASWTRPDGVRPTSVAYLSPR